MSIAAVTANLCNREVVVDIHRLRVIATGFNVISFPWGETCPPVTSSCRVFSVPVAHWWRDAWGAGSPQIKRISSSASAVIIPVYLLLGLSILASMSSAFLIWRTPNSEKGHCLVCGYSLMGNWSGRCPECGSDISATENCRRMLGRQYGVVVECLRFSLGVIGLVLIFGVLPGWLLLVLCDIAIVPSSQCSAGHVRDILVGVPSTIWLGGVVVLVLSYMSPRKQRSHKGRGQGSESSDPPIGW